MRHRLLPLALSLLLLMALQLGAQHLLAHVLQLDGHRHAALAHAGDAGAPAVDPADHAEANAGDALCQVCLVLATLAAVTGPVAWAWVAQHVRGSAPPAHRPAAPPRQACAPYRARGPPGLPAAA